MAPKGESNNKFIDNAAAFLGSGIGNVVVGLVFAVIGFVFNVLIQKTSNTTAAEVLYRLTESANSEEAVEQAADMINNLFPPVSLNSFLFAMLWFFLGLVVTEIFLQKVYEKKIVEEDDEWDGEDIVTNLLKHMTENVYNRCSNTDGGCIGCAKYASEKDALLRRYLYEESQHFLESIDRAKTGEYVLDSDIPKLHTLAITQMLHTNSNRYAVIQWIGSNPYSDQNKYDERFDSLDFDFMYVLLRKLTEPFPGNKANLPYYQINVKNGEQFKIKWLLVGKLNCMKNNFDYIFYVVERLFEEQKELSGRPTDIIGSFFEFYVIDESTYGREIDMLLRESQQGGKYRELFKEEPSMGIFGDKFMFVDSKEHSHHGSMYTAEYKQDGSSSQLEVSIKIFDYILGKAKKVEFQNLLEDYHRIINEDAAWREHLKSIWNEENSRKEYS